MARSGQGTPKNRHASCLEPKQGKTSQICDAAPLNTVHRKDRLNRGDVSFFHRASHQTHSFSLAASTQTANRVDKSRHASRRNRVNHGLSQECLSIPQLRAYFRSCVLFQRLLGWLRIDLRPQAHPAPPHTMTLLAAAKRSRSPLLRISVRPFLATDPASRAHGI
jgi:hypothetical protein